MAKETYYFSHDSNALTDTKILNMRADYGIEGYGLYWAIIEMMRNEEDFTLELNKNTYRAIKILTNTTIDIEKFINDCIEDYKLFKKQDDKFYSNSLLKRMEEKQKKQSEQYKKRAEAGRIGGVKSGEKRKNRSKTEANRSNASSNEAKEKEKKEKENKIKENKRNEIKETYNITCTKLPQVQKLTDKRMKVIDKFLEEFTVEQFKQICEIANNSNFLTGSNERKWKADFDFLMRIDKATSVLEGKYNNTEGETNGTDANHVGQYKGIDLSQNRARQVGKEIDDSDLL